MDSSRSFPQLRQVLLADALLSGATGLLMLLGAGFLASLLNLPEALLRYAGLALVPYVVYVTYVGTRRPVSTAAVWTVIVLNELWVVASVGLLLSGGVAPNAVGIGFVLFQAAVVAAFAVLQFLAVRRTAVIAA